MPSVTKVRNIKKTLFTRKNQEFHTKIFRFRNFFEVKNILKVSNLFVEASSSQIS